MPIWATSADRRSASTGSRLFCLRLSGSISGKEPLCWPTGLGGQPFFRLFPSSLLVPAVLLTTAATVVASQAVLSGAFALVQQPIQLGAVPRLEVRQTSEELAGQVYVLK